MVHTFEELRTRTPANPNEAASEAVMPQAAWEALLRDAVQDLRPPYTPKNPLPGAPDHPSPGVHRPSAPHRPPPPPHHHYTGERKGTGKESARDGEGQPGKGASKGPK